VNAVQRCRWQHSHEETLWQTFFKWSTLLDRNGYFVLLSPLGKARSRLPIKDNWTFFGRCYGWGARSEYRLKIGVLAPTGSVWPLFQVHVVVLPTNQSSYRKSRMIDYTVHTVWKCGQTFISFLPHCMKCRRGLAMRIPSVRLSVRHTRRLWQNGRNICPDLYTIWKNI